MLDGDLRLKYGIERKGTTAAPVPNFVNGIQVGGTALSTAELAKLDGVTAGTVTASKALVVGASKEIGSLGTITLADAANIVVNATTGTKIGTATTQKLGFYNVTPVVQPAHADQAAAVAASGGDSPTEAEFNAVVTLVNRLRTDLIALGLIKGSA